MVEFRGGVGSSAGDEHHDRSAGGFGVGSDQDRDDPESRREEVGGDAKGSDMAGSHGELP